MAEKCQHTRIKEDDATWIERCLDCYAWRMADEVGGPLGHWRDEVTEEEYLSDVQTPPRDD